MTSRFHSYNHFSYAGMSLLVQPHNSFVFALMETGMAGFLLYITIIKRCVGYKIVKHKKYRFEYVLFTGSLLFVLFLESTFFVAMGSASLWWLIIMIVGSSDMKIERGA